MRVVVDVLKLKYEIREKRKVSSNKQKIDIGMDVLKLSSSLPF